VESDLNYLRKIASEHLAKVLLDSIPDQGHLLADPVLSNMLLQRFITVLPSKPTVRYSILVNGEKTKPASAVELAADLHAIHVIGTHNFQQVIRALWKGAYTIQYGYGNRLAFAPYSYILSESFIDHFDPQRMNGVSMLLGSFV
jgi:hypothetical protein